MKMNLKYTTKTIQKLLLLFAIMCSWYANSQIKKDTVYVFYLGGQSNMEGYGKNSELPKNLNKTFKNVMIFQGNSKPDNDANGGIGKWETLQPGHGVGFESDGKINKLSTNFGIELSFADYLTQQYPKKRIAIIKYTRIGTSIDSIGTKNFGSWEPNYNGKNQYDFFLKTIEIATNVKDIDQDGTNDVLVPAGILWMQGESDADKTEVIANNYYNNLKKLIDLMRATFRSKNLPVVIGKISDSGQDNDGKVWDYCELVQYAQEKYVKSNKNTSIVRSTINYKYSDKYHYDSKGYIDFGTEFAKNIKL